MLDNCVPRPFGAHLKGHDVEHASSAGLAELANGALLSASAAAGFDVLLTVDRNMAKQQRLDDLPLGVIVVLVARNTEPAMLEFLPEILALLGQRPQRRVYSVGGK